MLRRFEAYVVKSIKGKAGLDLRFRFVWEIVNLNKVLSIAAFSWLLGVCYLSVLSMLKIIFKQHVNILASQI